MSRLELLLRAFSRNDRKAARRYGLFLPPARQQKRLGADLLRAARFQRAKAELRY